MSTPRGFRVEVSAIDSGNGEGGSLAAELRDAGLTGVIAVASSRLFTIEGYLTRRDIERVANELLCDPVAERLGVAARDDEIDRPDGVAFEVELRPGVMDPVAESIMTELRSEGLAVTAVRTARRFVLQGKIDERQLASTVGRVLANDCIERVVIGTAGVRPSPKPPVFEFKVRHIAMRDVDVDGLERLSREGHLFLSLEEMQAIQSRFRKLDREPTDLELETLAQTWSEHCVHKTLKSAVSYRGAGMPGGNAQARPPESEVRYANLLKDTIVRATDELMSEGRGPKCLSVFKDNAGIIAFDAEFGIAFKVETHNHPSAIEPYGGAATGVGGCIRDVIGCGLGAKPIADTDVFCVAPSDWPTDALPAGVLHPRRVLRGIVRGVADYGNRMGIPTVNGAIYFDPRYLGNPLVFCGCVGLIPRDRIDKAVRPGDLIVVIGGRTGRDGIHGATFSSAELTGTHADEFSHAVQIGNAITEKRVLDAALRARDANGGCLYSAITDCGAGGLSSAVGEMAEEIGAIVDLERVPLKYAGLRYDEIWISEAQERMVLAVPPANIDRFMQIMRDEEVEATAIGVFGTTGSTDKGTEIRDTTRFGSPRLIVRYNETVVGELDCEFLHRGLPKRTAVAEWVGPTTAAGRDSRESECEIRSSHQRQTTGISQQLLAQLRRPSAASKAWVIRSYDHEVQGASVVTPLGGRGAGPNDAAVLRPRLNSQRGIAIGCGLAPHLFDVDPYWMAIAAIDEAIRNVVCVGGDPAQTAILDNFCWGRCDDPQQLGALTRACQACYDAAKAYGTPFISGKDSLNNEFLMNERDVEALVATLRLEAADNPSEPWTAALPQIEERLRRTRRLSIPGTLLISALSLIDDVSRCVTSDLKGVGHELLLVGGLPQTAFALADAARVHQAVAAAIQARQIVACHDVSDGGWLTAVAEMAIGGRIGFDVFLGAAAPFWPFDELCAAYVVETADADGLMAALKKALVPALQIGRTIEESNLRLGNEPIAIDELARAWSGV